MTQTQAPKKDFSLPSIIKWLGQKGYSQGVFWIILVALTSNMNDILMRIAGVNIPPQEVTFFRYFFATLTLFPVMLIIGKKSFYTKRPSLHIIRSLLLFGAMSCWTKGLTMSPLSTGSILAQTTQLFVLIMAYVFLKEPVGWQRTLATIAGFTGVLIIALGDAGPEGFIESFLSMNNATLFFLAAAMMFALSDIINKRFVVDESTLSMMFYIAVGTMLIALYPAILVWKTPTLKDLVYLLILGAGGNLILFFLLKAFAATDVSALSPFRYVEILSAVILGYLIFSEAPTFWTLAGAGIIIPSTFAISKYETRQQQKKRQEES
tara:strand:+ start:1511 stop:2476 length:966 start_codon:yes stop_codon:yes gene_type:complete